MMEEYIVIGRVGENGAEKIEIDLSEFREFGNGEFHLYHQRPNDMEPYEVSDIEVSNGILTWNISKKDVEYPGIGMAEIQLKGEDFLVKSGRYYTNIIASMIGGLNFMFIPSGSSAFVTLDRKTFLCLRSD